MTWALLSLGSEEVTYFSVEIEVLRKVGIVP